MLVSPADSIVMNLLFIITPKSSTYRQKQGSQSTWIRHLILVLSERNCSYVFLFEMLLFYVYYQGEICKARFL